MADISPLRHRMIEDMREFQVYLVSQGISWPALNQTVCVSGISASETNWMT
jgi:hypothetical protein